MKNLMFSLAFMLIGSFAFANNSNINSNDASIESEKFKSEVLKFDNSCLEVLNFDEVNFSEDLLQCHLTIKGTIDGKPVNIDMTWTSTTGSCINDTIKILKEVVASL